MHSKLLVTSRSNLPLLKDISYLKNVDRFMVKHPPNDIDIYKHDGPVYALGGGSVIDTAKIIAGDKACIAIPTNASGAAMTSHAVVWTKKDKIDLKTPTPVLSAIWETLNIRLSRKNIERTLADCYCHTIESRYSNMATEESKKYTEMAELFLFRFIYKRDIKDLIKAGNYAGQAIEITGTNLFHAISYIFTLDYGMCHGDALKAALTIKDHSKHKSIIQKAYKKFPKIYHSTII